MSRAAVRVSLAALVLLTIWAYSPVRSAGFVYEDRPLETSIKDWTPRAWPRQFVRVSHVAGASICGPTVTCAHAVSVGVHVVNGLLLFVLLRRWFGSDAVALIAAGVFLLHPINTEAVAYLGGRSDLLVTCFALIGLCACTPDVAETHRTQWGRLAIMVLACVGAMGSKEMGGVVAPLLLLAYGYQTTWRPSVWSWQLITPALVAVGVLYAAVVYQSITQWPSPAVQHPLPGLMSMQAAALWRALGLFLMPVGFNVDHDWALVPHSLAIAALAGLLLFAWLAWRSRWRAPSLAFGLGWIAVTLAPRFVIPAGGEYLNEHQLYLPMIGALIAAVALVPLVRDVWGRMTQADWIGAEEPA